MDDGAVLHYTLGAEQLANIAGAPEELDVDMNQVGASRNAGTTLIAKGGPCPIVVLRRADLQLGALVHISGENAEHDLDDHVALFASLLAAAPEIPCEVKCAFASTPVRPQTSNYRRTWTKTIWQRQAELRLAYVEKLEQHLQGLGFHGIVRLTEANGKSVYVNTLDGYFMFMDKDDNFLDPPGGPWAAMNQEGDGDASGNA